MGKRGRLVRLTHLAQCVVTQAQWEGVMGTCPWDGKEYVYSSPDHPAVFISWEDAQEFIAKLHGEGAAGHYRLPSEAEWEYACRAGTTSRWSFGEDENELGAYAWYDDNAWDIGEQYAHAVGQKRANGWGLYDMYGNVSEWCSDWFGEYEADRQVDPSGPATGSDRVSRSGAFEDYARYTRSACRVLWEPAFRDDIAGFRLSRTV